LASSNHFGKKYETRFETSGSENDVPRTEEEVNPRMEYEPADLENSLDARMCRLYKA
jgi:hypothetical protein